MGWLPNPFKKLSEAFSELDPFKDGSLMSDFLEGIDPTNPNKGLGQAIDWINPLPQKQGHGLDIRDAGDWLDPTNPKKGLSFEQLGEFMGVDKMGQGGASGANGDGGLDNPALQQFRQETALPALLDWWQNYGQGIPGDLQSAINDTSALYKQMYSQGNPYATDVVKRILSGQYRLDPSQFQPGQITPQSVTMQGIGGMLGSANPLGFLGSIAQGNTPTPQNFRSLQGPLDPTNTLKSFLETGGKVSVPGALSDMGPLDPTRQLQDLMSGRPRNALVGMDQGLASAMNRIAGETPTDFTSVADTFGGQAVGESMRRILGQDALDINRQLQNLGPANPLGALSQILNEQPGANPYLQDMMQGVFDTTLQKWEAARQQLLEDVLPRIRRQAQARGQYGSSRQAIVESKALQSADRMLRDIIQSANARAADIYGRAYESAMGRKANVGTNLAGLGTQGLLGLLSTQGRVGTALTGQGVQEALGRRQAATGVTTTGMGQQGAMNRTGLTTAASTALGLAGMGYGAAESAAGRQLETADALNKQGTQVGEWGTSLSTNVGQNLLDLASGLAVGNADRDLQGQIMNAANTLKFGDLASSLTRQNFQTDMAMPALYGQDLMTKLQGGQGLIGMGMFPSEYTFGNTQRLRSGVNLWGGQPIVPAQQGGIGPQTAGTMLGGTLGWLVGGPVGGFIGAGLGNWAGSYMK